MTFVPKSGDVIGGKYRVLRCIGEGGMGAVYEAENALTRKRIAIKWLHPHSAQREDSVARLVREAQASARIRHPNVVDVYDVERAEDGVFLVMEYLEGEPLTETLRTGGLAMHEIVALLLPAMRGVAAAHRQGVVHRDIKPDNIFLAREADVRQPVPKLLDFGISKLDPRDGEQLSLTRTGSTVGTPLYMSYEQLSGVRDIDGRTDIYAFGVILYEALTGHPPFKASTYSELVVKVATQSPVPPKQLRADIPTPLGNVVLWAMAKEREKRIPSMDVLIQELEPFATEAGFRAQMTQDNPALPPLAAHAPAQGELDAATVALPRAPLPASESVFDAGRRPSSPARATAPSLSTDRTGTPKGRLTVLIGAGLSLLLAGLGFLLWPAPESAAPGIEPRLPSTSAQPATAERAANAEPGAQPAQPVGAEVDAEWHSKQAVQALVPEPTLAPPQPPELALEPAQAARPEPSESPKKRVRKRAPPESSPSQPEASPATPSSKPTPPSQAGTSAVPPTEPKHRVNREPSPEDF